MTKIMKGGLSYCATSNMVALTQAQYDALSTAQKNNGNFYFITDANPSYFSAANIDYDNTDSGLSATDVQGAIDEVVEVVEDKADRVQVPAEYDSTATYSVGDYCIYYGKYRCCIVAISTPEVWTPAHWTTLPTPQQDYLHSIDPVGIGTLSMNRASGSTIGLNSVAIGYNGTASGTDSHAEGGSTTASGDESHAEGLATTASGYASHAEGLTTTASGDGSHAEGRKSKATGDYAHAEGYNNIASKTGAHAEGSGNSASQTYAHAEGSSTTASGSCSHSEGILTTASGTQAHAEGIGSVASGTCAHAEGDTTVANHKSQHVFGEFNIADASSAAGYERGNYIEIVGNGTSQTSSNARTLDWGGNEVLSGSLSATGCSISNTSNPRVSITADATVGGSITLYNIYNSKVIDINNTASKSQMDFYHASLGGLSGVSIYTGSGYGTVSARGTSTSTSSAYISGSNYGSRVGVSTLTGASCGELIGGSTGGSLVLKDHNTTTNITLDGSTGGITCSTVNGYNLDRIRCIERYTGGNSKTWSVTVDTSTWTCGLLIANTNNGGDGVWFVYKQNASDAVVISNIAVNPGNPTGFTAAISGKTLTFTCSGSISFRRCTWIGLN